VNRSGRSSGGFCALCGDQAKLEKSHIVPRFVYRALQVADGPTRSLLCGECEDAFSGYESRFARVVFYPLRADSRLGAKYEKWLLQFSASVCWRILEEHLAASPAGLAESRGAAPIASCRDTWRQFLVGKRSNVDEHPIHLLIADQNPAAETVGMEVVSHEGESFVYARLGPIILFGLITDPDRAQWQGTRVHLEGKLKPRETVVPGRYHDYLLARANRHSLLT
jgi:hypothetical protein